MKAIITIITISVLFCAIGCNYDYGKYGKEKTDAGSSQTNAEDATNEEKTGKN